ncbi:zinc ribbon domain-containing protein [Streptosporangium sp. NPDC000396]|uniref:zinc ribbon domain-containing protein n=1 Tax=Streptosporangium sp. NPDC000396 TaxID=3366185 RepID=UPI0036B53288
MRRFGSALVLLGGLVVTAATVVPALAHEHPSGITDLVTPAVVRVEARAHVDVTLLDHIGELVHVERSYEVPIGSGTGTVVNPEGAVVTLTRVVRTAQDVEVYAANKVFAEHHKVKIPGDFERHTIKDDLLNHHLQECYPPKQPTATCIFDVTTEIQVFPNITPPDKEGFKAEIISSSDKPDSPAVLMPVGRADGGAGLPTAPLAGTVPDKDGSPVAVAGFTGRPAVNLPETVDIAHLRAGGAGEGGRQFKDPQNKVNEPEKLGALVDRGLLGGPVIEDKKGEVVGLLVGGGKDARMIGVREITKALAEAKVTPRRGPIDAAFEQALTRFHTKYYGDAVPAFQRVLELYPGHTVAAAHLRTSQQKRGTAEDEGTRKASGEEFAGHDDGPPLWPFLAAGGVLVAAVVAGALLLWGRRSPPEPKEGGSGETVSGQAGSGETVSGKAVPGKGVSGKGVSGKGVSGKGVSGQGVSGQGVSGKAGTPSPGVPPTPQRPAFDEGADATVVVGRSFPPLPKASSPSPGQPVLVARDPGTGVRPAEAAVQKYCTACGMRLGPAHRFCGYCGHPAEM